MHDQEPVLMVEDDAALARLVERLSTAHVIGVDTESDSMYHYQEKVCLVQITDAHGDVIIDPLSIEDMSPLGAILADPGIVKVFHGADYDIVSLKRDFGYQTNNLFDTLLAAQFLGLDRLGLADLIGSWFGVPIDKKYQRHDWSSRPLLHDHLDYARGDTHYLLALREILRHLLRKAGRLAHHAEECELLSSREWQGRTFDPDGWVRIKKATALDERGQRVLRQLYLYRDDQARELDRPPYKVIGDRILLDIAQRKPTDARALDAAIPRMHALKRRHAHALLACVQAGLDDTSPLPDGRRTTEEPEEEPESELTPRLRGRASERVFNALKDWRNELVSSSSYTPYMVASNGVLKRIATYAPLDLEELALVPEVRRWQVKEHGPQLIALLDELAPDRADEDDKRKRKRKRRR